MAFKISLILLFFSSFLVCHTYAQDVILKRTGEKLSIKVKSLSDSLITYATADKTNPTGETLVVISVSEVASITYESGQRISFVEPLQPAPANSYARDSPRLTQSELFTKGRGDAIVYYQGYKGAATGTLIVSLLSPLVGLIPAVACSATPPSVYRVVTPDSRMLSNVDYTNGYLRESRRIKARRVWTNWGIGLGVNLALVLILAN